MFSFNSHGETYPQMTTDQELLANMVIHCMFDIEILQTCIATNECILLVLITI